MHRIRKSRFSLAAIAAAAVAGAAILLPVTPAQAQYWGYYGPYYGPYWKGPPLYADTPYNPYTPFVYGGDDAFYPCIAAGKGCSVGH